MDGKKQPYGDVWICPDLDSPLNMFTLDEDGDRSRFQTIGFWGAHFFL